MNLLERLNDLDRRWIFLLMGLAVAIPIIVINLTGRTLPEVPTPLAKSTFQILDDLEPGSRILMAWDFDPASEGELGPMANSFVRQCCQKGHRLYFLTLWPLGPQMIRSSASKVIAEFFPDTHARYGEEWVDLGFKAGNEAVIKTIVTDFPQMFPTDAKGTPLESIPMMEGIDSLQNFDAIINVSAGFPGSKEWVLYAATPLKKPMLVGCTGVQAPQMYPYVPAQVQGLLGAIKGAAEYESVVNSWMRTQLFSEALAADGIDGVDGSLVTSFPREVAEVAGWASGRSGDGLTAAQASAIEGLSPDRMQVLVDIAHDPEPGIFMEAQRRMGPQLVAHLLMIVLIVVGNLVYFANRRRGGAR